MTTRKADTVPSKTPESLSIGATEIRKLSSGNWPEVYIHVGPKSNRGNCVATVSMGGAGATSGKVEDVQATAEKIVNSYNSFDDLLAALKAQELRQTNQPSPFGHECDWCHNCCDRVIRMRRDAIAKAEKSA